MRSKVALDAWLIAQSPKQLLQKALLQSMQTVFTNWPGPLDGRAGFLSDIKVTVAGHYQYESAIAHRWAATLTDAAVTLAPRLATEITAFFACQSPTTIATDLTSHANSAGWLTFTLSPEGLQVWLEQWLSSPLPAISRAVEGDTIMHRETRPHEWPLCDRLRLSLPMLLQWAYGRCQRWQTEFLTFGEPARGVRETAPQDIDAIFAKLLLTVIHSLDQLASSPPTNQTRCRVSYRLAASIYELDGQLAGWRTQPLWEQSPQPRLAALMAAQKVLALLLAVTFRQSPCSTF
ncbi:MAG: hypothetical protein AAGD09_14745 [Cyanobacteria bacterium P01_F01_bin.56]